MTRRRTARADEDLKAVFQARQKLPRRQRHHPCRRQFNGQRQPVQQRNDFLNDGSTRRRQFEVGCARPRSHREQLHASTVNGQWLQEHDVLGRQRQHLAARDHEAGLRCTLQPRRQGRRSERADLLEVVEQKQAFPATGDDATELRYGIVGAKGNIERGRHRERNSGHAARLREVAEINATGPVSQPSPGVAAHQTRLARPTHA